MFYVANKEGDSSQLIDNFSTFKDNTWYLFHKENYLVLTALFVIPAINVKL